MEAVRVTVTADGWDGPVVFEGRSVKVEARKGRGFKVVMDDGQGFSEAKTVKVETVEL